MSKPAEIRAQIYQFLHDEFKLELSIPQHTKLKKLLIALIKSENESLVNQVNQLVMSNTRRKEKNRQMSSKNVK